MYYWILTQKVTVISRTTVNRLTSLEKWIEKFKASVSDFDTEISLRFKEEEYLTYDGSKPNPEDWFEYLEYYPDFQETFDGIINDLNVPEADTNFMPDVFDSTYLKIELEIPIDGDGAEFSKVTKPLRYKDGLTIGRSHSNPTLDTKMYEV